MKVYDLIALQDFSTIEAHGVIRGVKGQPIGPVMYSTAKRLIQDGLAKKQRTAKRGEGE